MTDRAIATARKAKPIVRTVDRTFGALARAFIAGVVARPLIAATYKVEIVGAEDALSCTDGALVVANHVSLLDGPFLMSAAWPYARIRATAWHAEYSDWKQWWIMKLFGVICLGSPRQPPEGWHANEPEREQLWVEERARRKAQSQEVMSKVVEAGRHLLVFCEGSISDGRGVTIPPHLSGVHDLIRQHPDKPVLLVKIEGLEHSRLGKKRPPAPLLQRLPVRLTLKRVDNVSLDGGPPGLNARLEDYFNRGTPVATRLDCNTSLRLRVFDPSKP
jgi:1-acyl-sn-glycerol-3-phosphate acyltransferase